MQILDARPKQHVGSLSPSLELIVKGKPHFQTLRYKIFQKSDQPFHKILYTETEEGYFDAVWIDPLDQRGSIKGYYRLDTEDVEYVYGAWMGNSMDINSNLAYIDISGPVMECTYFNESFPNAGIAGWITVASALYAVARFLPGYSIGLDDETHGPEWRHFWRLYREVDHEEIPVSSTN